MASVIVTGASSGFGAVAVRAIARRDHVVYAGIRDTRGRNADAVAGLVSDARDANLDLRPLELDVTDDDSADAAIGAVMTKEGRLDVNVLGTQRVNRAALPHLRAQGSGHLVWVGSTSTRGGAPPFLAPYFAAKAGMDALAVSYAAELIRFGIDTTIVMPGAYTSGTNHFLHAGEPDDDARAAEYEEDYGRLLGELADRLAALVPSRADAADVAEEIARVIDLPPGERPFRTHIDPSRDGSRGRLRGRRPRPPRVLPSRRRRRPAAVAQLALIIHATQGRSLMPFANLKIPAGSLTAEQKTKLVDTVTDMYADVYGERARPNTMVLVDEVADGGWGIGGQVLTLEMLTEDAG